MATHWLKSRLTKKEKNSTLLIRALGWHLMKSINISMKLPFLVLKSFWSSTRTVRKTVALSDTLVLGFTRHLWLPKKLRSSPSHTKMSQQRIGLVMGLPNSPWKSMIKKKEVQKSFCTSTKIRKSFWRRHRFVLYWQNTTSLCPFLSRWAQKKLRRLKGMVMMPKKSKKLLMISSITPHLLGFKNQQIWRMKITIIFIESYIRHNLKSLYFKYISMLTILFTSPEFSISQKYLTI